MRVIMRPRRRWRARELPPPAPPWLPAVALFTAALALTAQLVAAAAAAAATPAPCIVAAGASTFDLSQLGGGPGGVPALRHVSSEPDSRGWIYFFAACGEILVPADCGAAALQPAALQVTQGACYSLGSSATRTSSVTPSGVSMFFSGGDGGRSTLVTLECADVPRPRVVHMGFGTVPSSYTALIRMRGGCALECARDPATGAPCGGEQRGTCVIAATPDHSASCICTKGHSGPLCLSEQPPSSMLRPFFEHPVAYQLPSALLAFVCAAILAAWLICLHVASSESASAMSMCCNTENIPRAFLFSLFLAGFIAAVMAGQPLQAHSFLASFEKSASLPLAPLLPCARSVLAPEPSFDDVSWIFSPEPRLVFGGRTLPLALLDWRSVRRCLRGRRLAFIGDSVTRYQYLNLVHFLARGKWYDREPALENEYLWSSWEAFFSGVSARLTTNHSRVSCDCFREHRSIRTAVENRVFEDLEANISVAYWQLFEGLPTKGVEPALLTLTDCREGIGCTQGSCSPGACASPTWSAPGLVPLVQRVVQTFRPDTVIINSGLWPFSSFATPERMQDLANVSVLLHAAGAREVLWKTTTPLASFSLGETTASQLHSAERTLLLPALRAITPPWRIFDAFALLAPLHRAESNGSFFRGAFFFDAFHPQPEVYRGLNEALLLDLMRGCELCDGGGGG